MTDELLIDLGDGGPLIPGDALLVSVLAAEIELAWSAGVAEGMLKCDGIDPGALAEFEQRLAEKSAEHGFASHPEGERLRAALGERPVL